MFLDVQINDYFTKIEHFKHEFLRQKWPRHAPTIKLLINMEEVGAVDGARNRYFMSSGGVWCPSTVTMVGFLASGGLWCPATAGTG